MRVLACLTCVVLTACGTSSPPAHDVTKDAWYAQATQQLAGMTREADALFQNSKSDGAAALIEQAQPIMNRLLSVPHPTFAAAAASSDLDDLYGRMLLSNRHYAWARLLFQKNQNRWRHWEPRTEETAKRLRQAEAQIAECDRHMEE